MKVDYEGLISPRGHWIAWQCMSVISVWHGSAAGNRPSHCALVALTLWDKWLEDDGARSFRLQLGPAWQALPLLCNTTNVV